MRFIADENISRRIVARLRADGFDVTSIAGPLSGSPDAEVLNFADAEGRILITEDRDFGELVVRRGVHVRGVILLELDRLSAAAEVDRVVTVIATHGGQLEGSLIVIEPARTRIRSLVR